MKPVKMETVVHLPTGMAWVVRGFTSRPGDPMKKRLALATLEVLEDGHVLCPVTGERLATGPRSGLWHGGRLASIAADRVVMDHPAFRVTGPVAYALETVVGTSPVVNGSGERVLHLPTLERLALERLKAFGTRA
jgi:hypothetical protein